LCNINIEVYFRSHRETTRREFSFVPRSVAASQELPSQTDSILPSPEIAISEQRKISAPSPAQKGTINQSGKKTKKKEPLAKKQRTPKPPVTKVAEAISAPVSSKKRREKQDSQQTTTTITTEERPIKRVRSRPEPVVESTEQPTETTERDDWELLER